MKIQSIFLLIVSIMLVIVTSWNVNIFIRLEYASSKYSNDKFDTACGLSNKYSKNGKIVSIVMLLLSVLLMIGSSIIIYKNNL
jgi:hypothetical protein